MTGGAAHGQLVLSALREKAGQARKGEQFSKKDFSMTFVQIPNLQVPCLEFQP